MNGELTQFLRNTTMGGSRDCDYSLFATWFTEKTTSEFGLHGFLNVQYSYSSDTTWGMGGGGA